MAAGGKSLHRREAGFSLLELLVALTILALAMSVVSISASRRSPSFEMQRLTAEAVSLFREARLAAQTSGQPAKVSLLVETRELRAAAGQSLAIPEGVTAGLVSAASAGPATIVFFPDGSSSGGELTFEGGDRSSSVTVDWLTSRIEERAP